MKKFMQKKLNQKGLTLVELLAVIVILGIIAAIAVPAIGNIITNSKVNALKADGQNAIAAGNIYYAEAKAGKDGKEKNSITIADLKKEGYLQDSGGLEDTATVARTSVDNASTITINGIAKNGDVTVTFTSATNAAINAAGTKEGPYGAAGTGGTVTVAR